MLLRSIVVYLHANNISIAVAVMFPGLLLQQPAMPVQNATKMEKNATMKRAMAALPMSVTHQNS